MQVMIRMVNIIVSINDRGQWGKKYHIYVWNYTTCVFLCSVYCYIRMCNLFFKKRKFHLVRFYVMQTLYNNGNYITNLTNELLSSTSCKTVLMLLTFWIKSHNLLIKIMSMCIDRTFNNITKLSLQPNDKLVRNAV